MAITVAELRALITADDAQYQQRMAAVLVTAERARSEAAQMASSFEALGPALLKAGAAMTALGAAFGFLVKAGSDLQTALVHVAGNTSMSAAEFENLQTSVVHLGLTVPVAMDDIGRAYMQAANFGFHFADANAVVEAALKSAVATGANAEQTTRALAVAMHLFTIPATEAAKTMDVLHLAAARGGQTLEQFTAVTGRVFSVAHAMGVSLVDVSAALSALTSSGLSAAQSATLLQGAIVKIANPAKQAAEEVKRLSQATGIDLVGDFSKAGLSAKGLSGVMEDIGKAVGNNTAEILKLVPALRGGIGVILLTTTASKDYKDRLQELNDVMAGKLKPTAQDFERVMQTLGAQTTILQNSFQALGFELVKSLGPSLVGGLETLNGVLPQAVLFIGQLPPVILGATAAFVTAIGVVGTVSVTLGALVLLLGGPVTAAILGIGIVVGTMAAAVALNFGRVTAIFTAGTGTISLNFAVIAAKAGAVADAFQIFARVSIAVFDIIVTGAILMAEGVKLAFDTVKDAGKAALALVSNDVVGFASAMASMSATTLDSAKAIGGTLKGLIGRIGSDLADISSHASGQFAKSFGLAALQAGQSFADASAKQHQLMEDAGLKLVNAYLTGVMKAKPMSAAMWHSMTDDARASFTATAQAWIQSNTALDGAMDDANKKRGKKATDAAREAAKALDEVLKEQLDGVNDWLKAIDSKTQISEPIWQRLLAPDTKDSLLKAQAAFHAIQDVIQQGQADLLAQAVTGLAGHRQVIDVSIADWQRWGDKLRATAEKLGVDIKLTFIGFTAPMLKSVEEWNFSAKEVEKASDEWVKGLDKIKIAAPPAADALGRLREALKSLREDIAANPLFAKLRLEEEITREFDGAVRALQEQGVRLNKTQDQTNQDILKGLKDLASGLTGIGAETAKGYVDAFKRQMDKLPGALDEIFNKLALGAKHQVSGLFDIINNIPGKFGDALRKTTSTITTWINQIDGILKGLHKLFASIPDGLAGALSQVIELFHHTTTAVSGSAQDASQDWAGALEKLSTGASGASGSISKAAGGIQGGADKIVGAFGQIAGAALMFVGAAQGGGGWKGAAQGAFSGALGALGAAGGIATLLGVALSPLTLGLSALGGALIGGLIGAFSGGKSSAQKAQEAQQLEQMKISVQQSAQSVINAAIQGFDAALAFFEKLDEFTMPRKAKFQQFFKAFSKLMDYFLELSKAWAATSLTQAKAAAEAIGPVADALSKLPDAFAAINGHFGVAQSAIDRFFDDFDKVMTAFFARSEVWIDGISKRAMKVADRLTPVVALISGFATAVADIGKVTKPDDSVWGIFDTVIEQIVSHVAALSDKFDKAVLKVMANFADKAGSALTLFKDGIDSIKAIADISMPSDADFANVFAGIEKIIVGMEALAERLSTDSLGRAEAIATSSLAIFASIKAGVEALSALKDFTGVLPEVFDAFFNDFNSAVDMLASMAIRAMTFDTTATTFKNYIASGSATLAQAFTMLQQIVNAAGGFFPGANPTPVVIPAAASSSAPATARASATPMNDSQMGAAHFHLTLTGDDPRTQAAVRAFEALFGVAALRGTSSQFA